MQIFDIYILGGMYVIIFSSVAPHYVKEAELGNSHFLGRRHGQSEVVTIGCGTGTKDVLKMKCALLAFCLLTMAL